MSCKIRNLLDKMFLELNKRQLTTASIEKDFTEITDNYHDSLVKELDDLTTKESVEKEVE